MAEGVLFNIAEGIIGRLGSLAFQKTGLIWSVQDEFNKLQQTVVGFQAVLLDAEQKQAANNEVKLWLQSVKDAVYEADDVLDEFNAEAQRRQMVPETTKLSKKVRRFFSSSNQLVFGLKMGHKIKDINKRLSELANRRTFYLEVNHEDARFVKRERVTHSFVRKENIIGRDEDKMAITQLLLDPISTENVSTISIVGFGGLGKTALAQSIFNEELIQKHFELKIWTCVSNVFELDIVVKKILRSENHDGIEQLQNDLRKKVDGKKYLLVLDDVWNEDRMKWLSFKNLLMGGGEGSRILITTRSKTVATISDTAKPYILKGLNEDQSWSLFKKMAYKDGKEPENQIIKEVGKDVARKCQGVPLVIKMVGGMLFAKDDEIDWLNFRENKLSKIRQEENEILPTLQLSYDVLPSYLKHCFAYCSLFPLDYEISVKRLIRLWVAQGFIKSCDENKGLEDVAYEYYKELLSRSFFQEEETDEFGIIVSCKMHNLMNELAISVSGAGNTVVDLNRKKFHEKLCHVSFNFDIDLSKWEVPTSLLKANKIRTFLFLRQQDWCSHQSSSHNAFYTTIVSNFKLLRMLSLNKLGITILPNCLRKMKHLRYLDLSCNPIEKLPGWIVGLSNLETLDLTYCGNLVELPRDIEKMINLRHLILEHCYKLTRIPRGLGKLNGLRTLDRFVLSENSDSAGLGELGTLKELRGELEITNLRHERDGMSESNVGTPLKEKQHLQSLTLNWKEGEDVNAVQEDILEVLQPHSNLMKLSVYSYNGVRFANWFSFLENIVYLKLSFCERCQHLPPLDYLRSLKFLQLSCFKKLEYISDNASSSINVSDEMMAMSFFPSLKELHLKHCPVLKGWWRAHTHNSASSSSTSTENVSFPLPSFPCLSTLRIMDCPNLTSMPLYPNVDAIHLSRSSSKVLPSLFVRGASDITHDGGIAVSGSSSFPHLSKLTRLSLDEIKDLECITSQGMGNLPSLQSFSIGNCPNLASLPYQEMGNLASFRELTFRNCSNLTSMVEGIANLRSLQSLSFENCPNLAALPEGIANLISLQKLTIGSCSNLTLLPEGIASLTSLQSLKIEDCPNLAALPEGIANLTSLQLLYIGNVPNLAALPEGIANLTSLQSLSIENFLKLAELPEGIANLRSLKSLSIGNLPSLAELPEGIANLRSLKSLSIGNLPNWAALPEGIANLTSLQSLSIENFQSLAALPEKISNLTSLQHLAIKDCSNLASLPERIRGLPKLQIQGCPKI